MHAASGYRLTRTIPSASDQTHITRAVLALRQQILDGNFKPGERLSELGLVEVLGVSRTPVRLALATLEHEGLVTHRATGGYQVRQFSRRDVEDAIELRGVIEGTAARFAAERGLGAAELAELQELNDTIRELVHQPGYSAFEDYVELNSRFHAAVLAAAHSPVVERALEGVVSLPFAGPNTFVLAEAELPESREILLISHRQHLSLIEAIAARQSARAEAIAREHAHIALTNLELVLRGHGLLERLPGGSLIVENTATGA